MKLNTLRREKIKEFIKHKQIVSLKELSGEFSDVSVMTLHRDLDFLAKEGVILRIRGGAKYLEPMDRVQNEESADVCNKSQKDIVAQKAVGFIREGSSIFLDGGTTMMELAKIIPDMYLNVVTNGPDIALAIAEKMRPAITLCGGCSTGKIWQCLAIPRWRCCPRSTLTWRLSRLPVIRKNVGLPAALRNRSSCAVC